MVTKQQKELFDNLLRVLEGAVVFTGATAVSLEMDFDLPRGYVAKIHKVILKVQRIAEDIETISVDKLIRYILALLKDPDDTVTTTMTSNRVKHDVLIDHEVEVVIAAGTAGDTTFWVSQTIITIDFAAMGIDVIIARNMRLNADVEGTDAADGTEAFAVAHVYYTLEEITDDMILDILEIF